MYVIGLYFIKCYAIQSSGNLLQIQLQCSTFYKQHVMTEINPALALERKIIWCCLAIYICASWLWNVVGEVTSHPSSLCRLHISVSTELSAARCEPCLSKSWGKDSLQNLSGASASPAALFPVGRHWGGLAAPPQHGLALLSCQEQPQPWHCPGAIAGTTASLFFNHWTPWKPLKSCGFSEDYEKKRESKSFTRCQVFSMAIATNSCLLHLQGAQTRVMFWHLQLSLIWQPRIIHAKQKKQERGVGPLEICATKPSGPVSLREGEGRRNQSHFG